MNIRDILKTLPKASFHLTLSFGSHGQFMASYKAPGAPGYRVEHDPDPVVALQKAMGTVTEDRDADILG